MSSIQSYWRNLSGRDQQFLVIGGLIIVAILFYSFIWTPVQNNLDRLRSQVVSQSDDLAWMQQHTAEIKKLNQQKSESSGKASQPILTVVDKTAKRYKIRDRIKQIQPGKETGTARVWFDKVVFEDWLKWLDQISNKGIEVTRVSITKSADFPRVNIRLELSQ